MFEPHPQSKPTGDTRAARAFTLVEILVVVVILGLVSAIIVPQIGTRSDLKVASAARMVVADLTYAQNRAIATGRMHYVQFDLAAGTYRILTDLPSTVLTHPVSKDPFVVSFGAARTALADVALESAAFDGMRILCFDELGSPFVSSGSGGASAMEDGEIELRSGDRRVVIRIEPYTGEISVQ